MSKCPHSTNTQSSAVGSSLSDQHSKVKEPVILLQQKERERDKGDGVHSSACKYEYNRLNWELKIQRGAFF